MSDILRVQRDEAIEENDRLRQQLADTQRKLKAAEKDAGRYRFLRDHYHGFEHLRKNTITYITVDGEVDKAMKRHRAEQGSG